ncbi:hypothetical protein RGQ29_013624 [Quercus rubra]|uniref:Uncharacterized protein n=1 Tax=Quercus rubra TaxID=3512 RepID=A0AAN7I5F3_QUERU|nr:hypothetical protein RGQ29_031947 [Quercus rubra]KAK4595263.1 hypothetical protein RGQ29_013624 [Quercus rubra]
MEECEVQEACNQLTKPRKVWFVMNQIFTCGCTFEKGPQKQVFYHFIMEARKCIMEHIMCKPYYMVADEW